MAIRTLTDKFVQSVKPRTRDFIVFDSVVRGFGLKVTPKDARSWILNARYPDSRNWTKRQLAAQAGLTLAQARDKARRWQGWISEGKDPTLEEAMETTGGDGTFQALAEAYIAAHLNSLRSGKGAAREIRAELIPVLGARAANKIARRDIVAIINGLKAKGKRHHARHVLGQARQLFAWGLEQDAYGLEFNPAEGLKPKRLIGELGPRQRFLDDFEVAAFWRAAGRMRYPMGSLYQLLLLTGLRLTELAHARWRELHPQLAALREVKDPRATDWRQVPEGIKRITIPAARFKGKTSHVQPLSDDACRVLASLPRFGRGDFIFTTTFGKKPVNGFSKPKEKLDAIILRSLRGYARLKRQDPKQAELPPFVIHDLRRVIRTALSALRVEDHVAEMVLGHGRRGLQRVYDRHKHLAEIQEALQLWAAKLASIVSAPKSDNVVRLVA